MYGTKSIYNNKYDQLLPNSNPNVTCARGYKALEQSRDLVIYKIHQLLTLK